MSHVVVVGTGYVGLTTGACLAHLGHHVTCADIDSTKISKLSEGRIPIFESGLENLVREGLRTGRLHFVVNARPALAQSDFTFLCLPTPERHDGSADLSYLQTALETVRDDLRFESIVINKSTVPVGTVRFVERVLARPDVGVVSNPEFLREGSAVHDFLHPDRVVIGAVDQAVATRVASLYSTLTTRVITTDPESAELIKYASNAFLATKLSFVNQIAALAEAVSANVDDVIAGMGSDKRIGESFLRPGPGWGGSCFPKDTKSLISIGSTSGIDMSLIRSVVEANEERLEQVVDRIEHLSGSSLKGKKICLWGLTFKANTDDLRESPALKIATKLISRGAQLSAYDPTVHDTLSSFPLMFIFGSPLDAAEGASCVVVLTEWDEFKWIDPVLVAARVDSRTVLDARGILNRSEWQDNGFTVSGIVC